MVVLAATQVLSDLLQKIYSFRNDICMGDFPIYTPYKSITLTKVLLLKEKV